MARQKGNDRSTEEINDSLSGALNQQVNEMVLNILEHRQVPESQVHISISDTYEEDGLFVKLATLEYDDYVPTEILISDESPVVGQVSLLLE